MIPDYIPPALWALGWFVTTAGWTAYCFADPKLEKLFGEPDRSNMPPIGFGALAAVAGLFLWPALLAWLVGWFLWPLMAKLMAAREALRRD